MAVLFLPTTHYGTDMYWKYLRTVTVRPEASKTLMIISLKMPEPFLQADCLREIIPYLKSISSDILIYSGYTKNELIELGCLDILKQIAVLIDGKYIESRNTNKFLRGSDNQTIHILNNNYLEYYQNYISTNENEIQNFRTRTGFVSVGIHKSDYQQKLHEHLALKGFKTPKIIKI